MNPLTNTKNIQKLSEQELRPNLKSSWHDQYRGSAWVFVGGLPYDLTEGDVIAVFSQYGEIVNINLIRDKDTGKSKGFCFLCYEDQRSTILAVDNFNGIKILGRTIRVDHVTDYKMPKDGKKTDAETKRLHEEGCAPKAEPLPPPPPTPRERKPFQMQPQDLRETLVDQIASDIKLPMRLPIYTVKEETSSVITELPEDLEVKTEMTEEKEKKVKKEKKHKSKKKRKKSKSESSSSDEDKRRHKKKQW